ncbi:6-pyruvoyl-tetrahydropterin synthase-related protein [Methanotorris igneus]|uniref:Membrane protein 6-pyruvoyl-tetrahydropterin synthase-related domain-containing protein n=1 Tax=Methanotorris igneus (strain DSM 5666 / JCM 11834 / Kol 5) TaxID=880724 RepID=F6BBC9_METIK|nr:6-pyruvoyl-tetrahydropterin synthase-related protein [Methanotorris igneus]AEF97136.1 hypothetical protein Metig_1603 [Methanotorris igneus Kol 5]
MLYNKEKPYKLFLFYGKRIKVYSKVLLLFLLTSIVLHPFLNSNLPPGVDTPSHLEKIWLVSKSLIEKGQVPFWDPYWYGGYPPFKYYPPLSYWTAGILSFLGFGEVLAYKIFIFLSFFLCGYAVYLLSREIGMGEWSSFFSSFLFLTSYPLFSSISLWGWYPTVCALPFMLFTVYFLKRCVKTENLRYALLAGVCFGLTILTHHLTAYALAIVFIALTLAELLYFERINIFIKALSITLIIGFAISSWWLLPFVEGIGEIGFKRPLEGGWFFTKQFYFKAMFDKNLIGLHVYPSYIGITLLLLGVIGGAFAHYKGSKDALSIFWSFLTLFLVSFGTTTVIYKYIPFSNQLDVARFWFYMVPFLSIIAGYGTFSLYGVLKKFENRKVIVALFAIFLIILIVDHVSAFTKAYTSFKPFVLDKELKDGLEFIKYNEDIKRVWGIGFWNWHAYLIPAYAGKEVTNGWYDEGTKHWKEIQELRLMEWTGNIDLDEFYKINKKLNTTHIAIYDYYPGEHPKLFKNLLEKDERFKKEYENSKMSIFELKR